MKAASGLAPAAPRALLQGQPVRRVLVLRALMLGDLLCATPALRALRRGLPGAHISLLGLPWAQALCERLPTVDRFIAFPGWPGLPEVPPPAPEALQAFVDGLRAERFDLAVQLHGSGGIVNPLLLSFNAARTAGFATGSSWPPGDAAGLFTEWPTQGTEVERLLALIDHLGLPRQGLQLDFPLRPEDHAAAAALCAPLGGRPYAVVHAGSQLPSRRWPPERFAAAAQALAGQGLALVLTGSAGEAALTARVQQLLQASTAAPVLDLAGRTSLWTLGALVQGARVVLANDTGISHIAAALGTPSVVVASGSDVARWAPADAARHQVLWHDLPCRPCAHAVCPLPGHPCAQGVPVQAVLAALPQALALPSSTRPAREAKPA